MQWFPIFFILRTPSKLLLCSRTPDKTSIRKDKSNLYGIKFLSNQPNYTFFDVCKQTLECCEKQIKTIDKIKQQATKEQTIYDFSVLVLGCYCVQTKFFVAKSDPRVR